MPGGNFAATGLFFLLSLLMTVPAVIGWVVFLVACWRTMKAHERLASSLDILARNLAADHPR